MSLSAISPRVNQEVLDGWSELLSRYRWDWFATLTWRRDVGVGMESAVRSFRGWLYACALRQAVRQGLAVVEPGGRPRGSWANAYRAGKAWAVPVFALGVERHGDGVIHLHGLVKFSDKLGDVSRRDAWADWFKRHGINRIEPPKSSGHVARYVSKYIAKDGEIVLSGSFDAPAFSVC